MHVFMACIAMGDLEDMYHSDLQVRDVAISLC